MREEIIAHAQAGYPEEVCGIISGRDGVAVELFRGRNVSPRPRTTYEMDVETLMRQIAFDDAGLMLAAIYHSHPAGPPRPPRPISPAPSTPTACTSSAASPTQPSPACAAFASWMAPREK